MAPKQKQKAAELQLWQTAAPVEFLPRLADKSQAQALLIQTRQGPGYAIAAGQLGHAIAARATHLLLDYSQAACAIRYQVDGLWEELPPLDREAGDAMLVAIKQLCRLNPADRRSGQQGGIDLKVAKEKYRLSVQSKGTPQGERVLIKLEQVKSPFERLADLGMRDKMVTSFKQQLDTEGNLVLISAPKGEGLTTTWSVAVQAADRFIRDFQSFEDQALAEPEIINVNQNFFAGDTGKTAVEVMHGALLKEPDVIMFPELPDVEVLEMALGAVEKLQKQIYTRMVSPNALQAWVQLIAKYREQAADLAKFTAAVLGQRLVRRLCENCKEGFEPPPALLQKLGIPAGRVGLLYQPFILPPIEQQVDEHGKPAPITPCHVCNGRGYHGRIAIFELLLPGPKLREAMLKTQDLGKLNQIAKSEGHRGIQQEAVLTFARGLTSMDELKKLFAKK